jgi:biopolymer transport protein ExbB
MIERLKDVIVLSGASWVLWLLIGISVISIGIMLERFFVFSIRCDDVDRLIGEVDALLRRGDIDEARARLSRSPSREASIALAGLDQWSSGRASIQEAIASASGLLRARLERRLMILGTVGNNAPFIGLLGTVIGVVGAFEELGRAATTLAPERVMGTIAEALVATAAGLVVAIPAVVAFNYFQGRLGSRLADVDTLGHVLLTHLERTKTEA